MAIIDSDFLSNATHLAELGLFVMGFLQYRNDRKKDSEDRAAVRDKLVVDQTRMHTENKNHLDELAKTQESQDVKIDELVKQTAELTQIARAVDRRLVMLEDRL